MARCSHRGIGDWATVWRLLCRPLDSAVDQSGKGGSSPHRAEPTTSAAAVPTMFADVEMVPSVALSVLR